MYGYPQARVGARDRKIGLLRLIQTLNDLNEPVELYRLVGRLWAQVQHVRMGPEMYQAAQQRATRLTRFYVMYRADVTTKDRIEHDGQYYKILSVCEIGRRELLEITAEYIEGLDNG